MKLHLSILEKLIDLPTKDARELRQLLDDTGLEVKGVDGEGAAIVFNIETLANRGDTLCALGVARELSARLLTAINLPSVVAAIEDRKASVAVRKNTTGCLRYALLELVLPKAMQLRSDVAAVMGAPSPDRHAIVEYLNYIWLELGQPMHAFDRDKVEGEVIIEALEGAQEIVALDGKSYLVPEGAVVIKDRKKILAVAGVIGCQNSMVTPQTTRVLVESATFDPVAIRKARRAMNINTDASHTFERGSDVENVKFALQRLVYLTGAAGGAVKDGNSTQVVGLTYIEGEPTERRRVKNSVAAIRRELHAPRLAETEIYTRLKYLGFGIEPASEPLHFIASVPSWRLWDIRNPEDLVEEFVRVYGLNKVKAELPPLDYEKPELDPTESFLAAVEPVLLGCGFSEVITKGFISSDDARRMWQMDPSAQNRYVGIRNAVESSYSHLKESNLLHMGRLCENNLRRGVESIKVYEFGRLFSRIPSTESRFEFERDVLSLAATGRWMDTRWRKEEELEQVVSFFKGTLEALAAALGVTFVSGSSKNPILHPGMQAVLKVGRTEVGFWGVIHPQLQSQIDLQSKMMYAELDVEKLCKLMRPREYRQASDLPAVWRDLTFKLPLRSLAADTTKFIRESDPQNLLHIDVVDDFRKKEEDFRRVSYRLIFQHVDRTLEGAEVDTQIEKILAHLKARHQLELAV
jgi:phenylalanyl-tRNA synthetase beta chain